MEKEWFLAIKFPSFKKSAAFELVLRHSESSDALYPSYVEEETDHQDTQPRKRVVPNLLMAESAAPDQHNINTVILPLLVTSYTIQEICRNSS